MKDEPLLSVRDLQTHFFADEGVTRAVDGATFDLHPGRTLGVVGESGCGKSVAARSILRIVERPGRIVGGELLLRCGDETVDLAQLPPDGERIRSIRGGDIGLVFQEPMTSFSPVHTVGNQLIEAVRLHSDLDKGQARDRAVELMASVGIPRPDERLDAYAWQLSGGLRQRAMIAMALSGRPRILIADEPTTALDVITQAQILDLIRDLKQRTNLAIMMITHDLGVIAETADDVAVMYLGRVVERGPVQKIFAEPRHPYTRALLSSIPSVTSAARVALPTISGSIPHPFARPEGCRYHPRCTRAEVGLCDIQAPATYSAGDGHESACHFANGAGTGKTLITLEPAPPATSDHRPVVSVTARPEPVRVLEHGTPELTVVRDLSERPLLLEVENLTKTFSLRDRRFRRTGGRRHGRITAVDGVSFALREGETLALVGESGSGKTTASRCIMRALDPDDGSILFRTDSGQLIDLAKLSRKRMRPLRSELQMVFQDPFSSLNPRMTVLDIVGEPLLVNGVHSRNDRVQRVEELLRLVGLRHEYMQRFPHAFSGGQRQRIGIARALALDPRLVVADEPVSALDVSVRAQTLNLFLDLQERLGLTYLFVSHDLSVVRHISDRIAVMYAGQMVEIGERDDLLHQPLHPYTAALLAAVPKPDPTARAPFSPPRGEPANPMKLPSGCSFHPRCEFAVERCTIERPAWEEIAPGRRVRCHRAAELTLPGADGSRTTVPVSASGGASPKARMRG